MNISQLVKSKTLNSIYVFIIILMHPFVSFGDTISYQYDDLHRLKQVDRSDGSVTIYNYDELGNRTSIIVTTSGGTIYYCDNDGDGYVDSNVDGSCSGSTNCPPQNCRTTAGNDCDDSDSLEHPGQTWYKDSDSDGYSDGTTNTQSCTRPLGYKAQSELIATLDDCNDSNPALHPLTNWYPDADSDTYGDELSAPTQQCEQPVGYVLNRTDCSDDYPAIHPGAIEGPAGDETCGDTFDNDCDDNTDAADSGCSTTSTPGLINLPETGQDTCYDSSGSVINCSGTGQDGDIQAGVAWPVPRFTPGTGTESECIIDNLTGLMWPKNANISGTTAWFQAVLYGLNFNFCGHSDWRLPNVVELESIINADEVNPAAWLHGQGFVDIQSGVYWTSTSSSVDSFNAFVFNIHEGSMLISIKSSATYTYILPVRGTSGAPAQLWRTGQASYYSGDDGYMQAGAEWPSPRFSDNSDGTVTDNLTGLMWLKDANCIAGNYPGFDNDGEAGDGSISWQHALDFVNGMNAGIYPACSNRYSNWHMPNRKEMLSLTDFAISTPAIAISHPFLNVSGDYWTSTTYVKYANNAWAYLTSGGRNDWGPKTGNLRVWPVREKQVGDFLNYFCDDDSDGHIDRIIDGSCAGAGCQPQGCLTTPGDDCNDDDNVIYPGAVELCDMKDNDCDDRVDEFVATQEICGDGIDQDCDGVDAVCETVCTEWQEATGSAEWSSRYGHASVVHDGEMWVMGGSGPGVRFNDVWSSADGMNWTLATASASWFRRDGLLAVEFDGKMWVMTGYSDDGTVGIEERYKRDVWYTSDGITWTQATASAPWAGRSWAAGVVYDGKIWIFGGSGFTGRLNDVWFTEDGTYWTQATNSAAWSAREGAAAVVHDGKMWIIGGYDNTGWGNDVWYSTDGINWIQATSDANWPDRSGHAGVVSGGRMWIMGGGDSSGYLNDVWYSTNGIDWAEATSSAGWATRSGPEAVDFNGKMWVSGGSGAGTYHNDVWNFATNTFYADADRDGYGNPAISISPCNQPFGYVRDNTDCDDDNPSINPSESDSDCDEVDDNCDGLVDDGYIPAQTTCGIGVCAATGQSSCQNGIEFINCTPGTPGETIEITCTDGLDNDCDGETDEGVKTVYYVDADGDGYGDPSNSLQACVQSAGYVTNNSDCDDSKRDIHPAATEIPYDGIDQDCSGNENPKDYSGGIYNNDQDFLVGARNNSGSKDSYFDGLVDEIRIWDIARTATEINTYRDHELTGAEINLQGYWKFTNTLDDSTSNVNVLTHIGTATYATLLLPEQGMSLDLEKDNAQYASVPDSSQTGLDITGDISIEAWIKFEGIYGDIQAIVTKWSGNTDNNRSYSLYYNEPLAKLAFEYSDTGTGGSHMKQHLSSAVNLLAGTWYHVAVSFDASEHTSNFYVNGTNVGSDSSGTLTSIFNSAAPFAIGATHNDGNNPIKFFDGLIDDVRVWNTVRAAEEITNYRYEGLTGSEPNLVGYWKLDNNLQDNTANTNNLVHSGTAVYSDGILMVTALNSALDLESSNNEYASITDLMQTGLDVNGDITIEAKVKLETVNTFQFIVSKVRFGAGADRGYSLWIDQNNKINVSLSADQAGTSSAQAIGGTALDIDTWYHIAAVYDGTYIRIYLNGLLDSGNGDLTDVDGDGYDSDIVGGIDCDDNDFYAQPNQIWYEDIDDDGYSTGNTLVQCERPAGYKAISAPSLMTLSGDCDDTNPLLNPDTRWYRDMDGDSYGDGSVAVVQCLNPQYPPDYVLDNNDYDDSDPAIGPPVLLKGASASYFSYLQDAYDHASDGDTIKVLQVIFYDDLNADQDKSVLVEGGYNGDYSLKAGKSIFNGTMTVTNGLITIGNFIFGN